MAKEIKIYICEYETCNQEILKSKKFCESHCKLDDGNHILSDKNKIIFENYGDEITIKFTKECLYCNFNSGYNEIPLNFIKLIEQEIEKYNEQ